MVKKYNEKHFCIDLIIEQYKTKKASFIAIKLEEDLDETMTPEEIQTYLNKIELGEDYEKESRTVLMNEIFDRDKYEETKDDELLAYLRHE